MSTTVRRKRRRRVSRLKYALQFGCLSFLLAVVGFAALALYQVTQRLPNIEELGLSSAATRIYSADGVLLARIFSENRDYIHIKDIPQQLQDATVAIEDYRFYSHSGLDLHGIGRALVSNVKGGHLGQGGSTITQQLARNAYELGKQKTLSRKLQEAVVALRLERKYSKKEILEGYLNEVYYGARSYGVQAAAMRYFGKPVSKLDLAESAMLAGIPQRPTEFDPFKNKAAARERRNIVLARMAELTYITPEQARSAAQEPVRLIPRQNNVTNEWKAPHFVDYVVRQLEERYGPETVDRGGLEVRTTLHYGMQQAAEQAVVAGLATAASQHLVTSKTEAALTCVDPHNGYIRAMVGGKEWGKSQFNRAISNKRQLGSSFKPFVYTAALNEGWNQYRTVGDSRRSWPAGNGKRWTPRNYDGRYRGRVSLRTAVALSINLAAINTADAIGIRKAIEVARRLGLKGSLPPYLPTAIGAGGGSTLEMAGAYGAFAVKGKFIEPLSILEVKDRDGNTLEQANPQPQEVVRPEVVQEMDEMLRAVITMGTGRAAGVIPDSFGKTGTTSDERDVWFVGFTPQLSTAVWVGNDNFRPLLHASGGRCCIPIWDAFMQRALQLNPRNRPDLTSPPGSEMPGQREIATPAPGADGMVSLKICPDSGLIATNHCPHWNTRKFKPEDAPTQQCDIHPGTALSPVPARPAPRPVVASPPVPTDTTGDTGDAATETANPPPPEPEPAPAAPAAGIVVLCADTGLRANPYCPRTITRRLTPNTPTAICRLHGPGR
ncbi:MAG TPA: PBP1A family penicillin-binding protein [Armatimonadota bacterium]|jgi:penicillin-binding protein 1A